MAWSKFFRSVRAELILFALVLLAYFLTFLLWHVNLTIIGNATGLSLIFFVYYLLWAGLRFRRTERARQEKAAHLAELESQLQQLSLAEREQQDLMRIWSHQMKVPLAAIDLMSQTEIDTEGLKAQVFALENYLNILLETIRIKNLATDFRFEEVSTAAVLRDLIKKYSHFFIHKGLSVKIEGDWQLLTDHRWFELALEQLVNNAIKYTETGGLIVNLTPGEIRLIDTGIGILQEDIPRLFEHGFTGYNGHLNQQKSTGLGLYLTKLIFDKLDFKLAVSSEVGVGSEIVIRKA